jgi:uncharacterized protein (AIM24 family)
MASEIYLAEDGKQVGPLSEEQVRQMVAQGAAKESTFAWMEGAGDWKPLGELLPDLFAMTISVSSATFAHAEVPTEALVAAAPAAAAVRAAPDSPPATTFEVIVADFYRMPKITVANDAVVLEAGALHYMLGNFEIQAQLPSVGGFIKAALTKEKVVRPIYQGTGTIFLEPTFGECTVLELKGEEWVLDKGAFLACDRTVTVDMFTNKAWAGLVGGEGFFQTKVSGHGKVLVHSQGPLERVELKGETLVVDGAFAVARSAQVDFRVEKATQKLFSAWTSGEGLLNTFRGTGTVLIAPVPNRFMTLVRQFGGLHAAISAIKRG